MARRLMQHVVRRSIQELRALLQKLDLSMPQLGTVGVQVVRLLRTAR